MIRRKKERPKWRYDFNCRKCDNIQEIHDNADTWESTWTPLSE